MSSRADVMGFHRFCVSLKGVGRLLVKGVSLGLISLPIEVEGADGYTSPIGPFVVNLIVGSSFAFGNFE